MLHKSKHMLLAGVTIWGVVVLLVFNMSYPTTVASISNVKCKQQYLPIIAANLAIDPYLPTSFESEPNERVPQVTYFSKSGKTYFAYPDERDLFKIEVASAGILTIEVKGHTGENAQLSIYRQRADGSLTSHLAYWSAQQAHILFNLPQGGIYFIQVYATGGYNNAHKYSILMNYPAADLTMDSLSVVPQTERDLNCEPEPTPTPFPVTACDDTAMLPDVFAQSLSINPVYPFVAQTSNFDCDLEYERRATDQLSVHLQYDSSQSQAEGFWGVAMPDGFDASGYDVLCFQVFAYVAPQVFKVHLKDKNGIENASHDVFISSTGLWETYCVPLDGLTTNGLDAAQIENFTFFFDSQTGGGDLFIDDVHFDNYMGCDNFALIGDVFPQVEAAAQHTFKSEFGNLSCYGVSDRKLDKNLALLLDYHLGGSGVEDGYWGIGMTTIFDSGGYDSICASIYSETIGQGLTINIRDDTGKEVASPPIFVTTPYLWEKKCVALDHYRAQALDLTRIENINIHFPIGLGTSKIWLDKLEFVKDRPCDHLAVIEDVFPQLLQPGSTPFYTAPAQGNLTCEAKSDVKFDGDLAIDLEYKPTVGSPGDAFWGIYNHPGGFDLTQYSYLCGRVYGSQAGDTFYMRIKDQHGLEVLSTPLTITKINQWDQKCVPLSTFSSQNLNLAAVENIHVYFNSQTGSSKFRIDHFELLQISFPN